MGRKQQQHISRRRQQQHAADSDPLGGGQPPAEQETASDWDVFPVPGGERWVPVSEIAARLGGVTCHAVRQWGRQGKLPLRRLFGDSGTLGMSEGELSAFLRRRRARGESHP